ncbi:helix-turn-helix transcriptional regulator [Massilia pinisoli]|uniref:Helix-turn-helix transcriptional regulator n=1 Tax=Massilia pinisoli TaxID=1772194 RepID=A0ABT1ZQR0_9BURK|nr:helix-turn-helix transcriptional regulator [Massilia pinisoli]MCS0582234.1 helix-turn-helix transcriptional regulator [Massilia pinisoli]
MFNLTIHAVYQSVHETDPWRSCLSLMVKYFRVANAALMVRPSSASDPGHLVCVPAGDPAMEQACRSKWYEFDPFIDVPPECVMLGSNLMTEAQWQGSAFCRDDLRQALPADARHVMGVNITTQAGTTAMLRLRRVQHAPPFDIEDKQRLAMFVPHIKQALTLTAHLSGNELQMKIYEEGLARLNIGVIVLDEAGQLLRANPTACQMLDSADGVRLAGSLLAANTQAETRDLHRLLASAREHPKRVTAMCLSRPSGRRKLTAVVRGFPLAEVADARARPMVAIFLRDPDVAAEPAHDIARQLFDFTPAEAQLAIELLNGLSLDEAAGKLGILRNTGRAHLRAIFSKTGVTRQSELVRVLLNGVLALSTTEK